jgi:hypothetical protein
MMEKIDDGIKLAEEILDKIQSYNLNKGSGIRDILLRYSRLVKILGRDEEVRWANQELDGYQNIKDIPYYRDHRILHSTNQDNVDGYILDSCQIIENKTKKDDPSYTFPGYEYPGYKNNKLSGHRIFIKPEGHLEILNLLINETYRKTTNILLELKYGKMENDIFEETRATVNKKLHEICPETLNGLTRTYEDLIRSENPYKLQEIALACRLVLKSFADAVYPPSDQPKPGFDGKKHILDNDAYVNRILAYIQENESSDTNVYFMKGYLPYLGKFLYSINMYANVGTHNKRSKEYAKRCVIYTYLVLGDIINLTDAEVTQLK